MLAAEVEAASRRLRLSLSRAFWALFPLRAGARPGASVIAHLGAAEAVWSGPGAVRLTRTHLVFEDGERRERSRLATVRAVERSGAFLWVQRRRAHDWAVELQTEADAESVEAALREATR